MAVVEADVVRTLQGVMNAGADGYIFFKYYDTKTTLINQYIDMVTRWGDAQIASATRTLYPDLYDDFLLNYICYRICGEHIMNQLMATGFTFTELELTVNKTNHPDIVKEASDMFKARAMELLAILQPRITIMPSVQNNVDPFNIWEDNFRSTAPWRGNT